jgi:hypothetical protein
MYIGSAIAVKFVDSVVVHPIIYHSCFACVIFQTLMKKSFPLLDAIDMEIFPT